MSIGLNPNKLKFKFLLLKFSVANLFVAFLPINSANQNQRNRYGFNDNIERIEVTGSRIEAEEFEPGRYLQENIVFSASVDVVFDLEVK